MSHHPTILPVASGPEDNRLYDINAEFRQIFAGMQQLLKISRLRKERMYNRTMTAVAGSLQMLEHPDVPDHCLLSPNRHFPVLASFSNTFVDDDAMPDGRRMVIRLLNAERPEDFKHGLFDLTLNTGECFYASNAAQAFRFNHSEEKRAALIKEHPDIVPIHWRMIHEAISYSIYSYYSQIPTSYTSKEGAQWLARFRIVPVNDAKGAGLYVPMVGQRPPFPPHFLARREGETRSSTFLHEDLRTRIEREKIEYWLQIQLHEVTTSEAENERALNCKIPWPENRYPWKVLGRLTLDSLIEDKQSVESLQFSPIFAPPELGIVLAQSPDEAASLNHMRVLLYRMAAAARRGEPALQKLEALLRPSSTKHVALPSPAPQSKPQHGRVVCVVGAGAAGLTAARQLEQNGHRAIVIEANSYVGGKCESVTIDGRTYDLGGHLCTSKYERLLDLCAKMNVKIEDCTSYEYKLLRPQHSQVTDVPPPDVRDPSFRRYMALRKKSFSNIENPELYHCAQTLSQPVNEWISTQEIAGIADVFRPGYTGAGYGYLEDGVAALHFAKYIEMIGVPLLLSVPNQSLQSAYPQVFTVANGFQRLWEKIATSLQDVRTGTQVLTIERHNEGVHIHTDRGTVVADDVIITVPLNHAVKLLNGTAEERDIASRVRSLNYYTTLCTIQGLPRNALMFIEENVQSIATLGHCVAIHHRYSDTDVYACFSYGRDEDNADLIAEKLREDIARLGGRLDAILLQRKWTYFPHFGSDDVKSNIYGRLEALQGQLHTYYAGSLLSFELVECSVAYAQELVDRFFPTEAVASLAERALLLPEVAPPIPKEPNDTNNSKKAVTENEVRTWLIEHIAAELQLSPSSIDPSAPLENLPLDSLSIVALHAELSAWSGMAVSEALFIEEPTISDVARALVKVGRNGKAGLTEHFRKPKLLVPLQASRTFFCLGGTMGSVGYQSRLARSLGSAYPYYGIQFPGHDGTEEPLDQVDAIAARCLEEIRWIQPAGPYVLGGHSFGGLVAYEIACQLRQQGEEVRNVFLFDTFLPVSGQKAISQDDASAVEEVATCFRLMQSLQGAACETSDSDTALFLDRDHFTNYLSGVIETPVDLRIASIVQVHQASLNAMIRYSVRLSDVPVTLLKAVGSFQKETQQPNERESSGDPTSMLGAGRKIHLYADDPTNGWGSIGLPNLQVAYVPGNHFNMFMPPYTDTLAAVLRKFFEESRVWGLNRLGNRGGFLS
jgi:thioesterase domain-containing protein/acyl carrier protein